LRSRGDPRSAPDAHRTRREARQETDCFQRGRPSVSLQRKLWRTSRPRSWLPHGMRSICNLSSATAHDSAPSRRYITQCNGSATPVQHSSVEKVISPHDAGEAVGTRIRDFDGKNSAEEAWLRLRVNGLQIRRATHELPGSP